MDHGTFKQLWLDDYLLKERGLAPQTASSYKFGAQVLERLTGKSIFEVTVADYRRYVRTSSHSARHKGTVLSSLKSAHRFYCLENDLPMNGVMALSAPRATQGEVEWVTPEQANVLIEAASHPLEKRIVFGGLFAGTRIAEACDGTVPDVRGILEWQDDRLVIYGKGRKIRETPIHPLLAEVADEIRSVPCPLKRQLEYRIQVLKGRTGIAFHAHMLRGGFGHQLEALETPHLVTKSLLGHAFDLTQSYSGGPTWKKKVAAIEGLNYEESR